MTEFSDAIFIKKDIKIKNIDENDIQNDILYLSNLYKKYEAKFENSVVRIEDTRGQVVEEKVNLQELNKNILSLVEEVGKLAAIMKKMI